MSESIFVVMTNDYPDCVFSDRDKAELYCEKQNEYQKALLKPYEGQLIYYRFYEFELNSPGKRMQRRGPHYQLEQPRPEDQEVVL